MAGKEFIIFCDESTGRGPFFSNFYGGLMVDVAVFEKVSRELNALKASLNLNNEVKWNRVSENYLSKYEALMILFFEKIQQYQMRIRIMFTQNAHVPQNITPQQYQDQYFLLYYQFLKHAFGLKYMETDEPLIKLRIYPDELPDTNEKIEKFKSHVQQIAQRINHQNGKTRFSLQAEDIVDVNSKDHVLLQCLDIVLGSVSWRLNNGHLVKPEGQRRRGKRTIAKEKLQKQILREVCKFRPYFNIGVTTGVDDDLTNRWSHLYRHWNFRSRETSFDASLTKKGQKK